MRHLLQLVLILALPLALVACGDGDSTPYGSGSSDPEGGLPTDFDPNDPDAIKSVVTNLTRSIMDAELDEDVMQDLYAIHERVLKAGDDPRAIMSIFSSTSWSMASYGHALMKFESLRTAMRRGPEKLAKELDETRKQVAELEERAAQATGAEKDALLQTLEITSLRIPSLEEHTKLAKTLSDPGVSELVERWAAKFDALEDE